MKAMCEYFGVDLGPGREFYLLPIVAEACTAQLPENWVEQLDANSNPVFVNTV